MKPLLSILSLSLLAACSNPSETIQQTPSAPAPAPNATSTPAAASTPAAGEDLSMVSQTSEFKKPQSTQEEAVLVESTVYSKTENGPALLTRHTLLPQDRLNQDHKTHGLVLELRKLPQLLSRPSQHPLRPGYPERRVLQHDHQLHR